MSNVHQLVKELATYEQQRKDLEHDLDMLDDEYDTNSQGAIDSLEYDTITREYRDKLRILEEQLDKVYKHIDSLEAEIDNVSNGSHGYSDDDY
jgi:chromosome segregation ATPase